MQITLNITKRHAYMLSFAIVLLSMTLFVVGTGFTTSSPSHPTLFTDLIRGRTSDTVLVNDKLVTQDSKLVRGGGIELLAFDGGISGSFSGNQVITAGQGFVNIGSVPFTVTLPAKGRIYTTGLLAFRRAAGTANAVTLQLVIDGNVVGSRTCYVPWDAATASVNNPPKVYAYCEIGMLASQAPLAAGTHTIRVQLAVDNQAPGSISFNTGGEGDGYKNVNVYGFAYEP